MIFALPSYLAHPRSSFRVRYPSAFGKKWMIQGDTISIELHCCSCRFVSLMLLMGCGVCFDRAHPNDE